MKNKITFVYKKTRKYIYLFLKKAIRREGDREREREREREKKRTRREESRASSAVRCRFGHTHRLTPRKSIQCVHSRHLVLVIEIAVAEG